MENKIQKNGTKNVFLLGLVSLFTDLSSQMIYPLLPEFLTSIGASKSIIGLIEGIADTTAYTFRTVFGKISDNLKKRKIFIFLGYALSSLSKPLLYFSNVWGTVLLVKFSDRFGKAMRTPPRDALISISTEKHTRGKAFGIHRAMDRAGAILGPLLAILILKMSHNNLRLVFLLSIIPAVISVSFIYFVKEFKNHYDEEPLNTSHCLKNPAFVTFLIANIIFAFGNSSNAFLLLKAKETGIHIAFIPLLWMLYNLVCSSSSLILGPLSDTLGRRPIIIISFLYYALIYFLFGLTHSSSIVWLLFACYGVYYGLSEGVFRAYIADLVHESNRATAYGIFNTGIGLALFPASLITGLVWDKFGSQLAFFICSGFSILGFLIFVLSFKLKKLSSC
jgi:MFS family permease